MPKLLENEVLLEMSGGGKKLMKKSKKPARPVKPKVAKPKATKPKAVKKGSKSQ